uniref:Uncharacterized protein n=1 Tax=Anopheles arabiensis TaxID=7173 RepID=A0A182IHL1_ANOAR
MRNIFVLDLTRSVLFVVLVRL